MSLLRWAVIEGDAVTDYRFRGLKIEVNGNFPLRYLHWSSNCVLVAPGHLTQLRISEPVKQFVFLDGEKPRISGGEPLFYDELSSVTESCQMTGIEPSLYTTGILRNGGFPKSSHQRETVTR